MGEIDSDVLAAFPIFRRLRREALGELLIGASVVDLPGGTRLFSERETPEFVHFLVSGVVELSRLAGGSECGVLMYTTGDVFMPGALFGEANIASARILTPSRVLMIRVDALMERASHSAAFSLQLCRLVAGQWRMAVRNILDLKCRTAAQRLGAFLLRVADENPSSGAAHLPVPKRHLAVRLGMKAETLSRTLQLIADNGLHLRGRLIIVKDRERIERFCGPDPYPERDETLLGVHVL